MSPMFWIITSLIIVAVLAFAFWQARHDPMETPKLPSPPTHDRGHDHQHNPAPPDAGGHQGSYTRPEDLKE